MIRVAFPILGGRGWTGGYNYLLNLVRVLRTYESDQVAPVLLFGQDCADEARELFAALPGVEIHVDPAFDDDRRTRRLAEAVATGRVAAVERVLRKAAVDVLFESNHFYGWRVGVAVISWIPDLQHARLPHLFSRATRLRRTFGYQAQALAGRLIMLSSRDARDDCERAYPAMKGRTRVVPFAVPRDRPVDATAAREVAARHGLPEAFFFLPNQFWRHKNHIVVVEALAQLKQRGVSAVVAASGNPDDPRHPGHFDSLVARAGALGVSDAFRRLGLIPYADVAFLMRASAAIINPSLFEGWSTTVEEAKAIGAPMILSSLPVHREQAGARAIYFDPHDAAELADRIERFEPLTVGEREAVAAAASMQSRSDAARFALAFADLAREAVERR